ncbi:MAG: hypothetical protein ABEJ99_05415 [Candidatus Nanohaloarchaea archaeon]
MLDWLFNLGKFKRKNGPRRGFYASKIEPLVENDEIETAIEVIEKGSERLTENTRYSYTPGDIAGDAAYRALIHGGSILKEAERKGDTEEAEIAENYLEFGIKTIRKFDVTENHFFDNPDKAKRMEKDVLEELQELRER